MKRAVARDERIGLAPAVGPRELDRRSGGRSAVERLDAPARRDAVLVDRQRIERAVDVDDAAVVVVIIAVSVAVMMVVAAAAEQPGAHGVDDEAEDGDRDRLGERDRPRRNQAADRLVGDQRRDHRQHDRAGEAGEIAELAGAEGEARIVGAAARERIGERGEQQRAGVGAHVEAVGDERDRAEHRAAGDLDHHHRAGQRDHRPDVALALSVRGAEEDVSVGGTIVAHGRRDSGRRTAGARIVLRRTGPVKRAPPFAPRRLPQEARRASVESRILTVAGAMLYGLPSVSPRRKRRESRRCPRSK